MNLETMMTINLFLSAAILVLLTLNFSEINNKTKLYKPAKRRKKK